MQAGKQPTERLLTAAYVCGACGHMPHKQPARIEDCVPVHGVALHLILCGFHPVAQVLEGALQLSNAPRLGVCRTQP
jgi:hypothetical protein